MDRKIATLAGWLMVVTFVTSIPAYFILYARCGITPTTSPEPAPTQCQGDEVVRGAAEPSW